MQQIESSNMDMEASLASKEKNQALIEAVNCLKVTLPKMTALEIPTTPENFTVWYQYSQGTTLKLNEAIDKLLDDGAEFTLDTNKQLHENFILDHPRRMMHSVQSDTENLIVQLLDKIKAMSAGSEDFSEALNASQEALKGENDLETIVNLVAGLVSETDKVQSVNNKMGSALEDMTAEVENLKSEMTTLNTMVLEDQLTRVANRRAFDEALDLMLRNYKEDKENVFCLLMTDVDHFKAFNDTHGHATGDKVLTYVATTLKSAVKGDDIVARYGGEEFAILFPGTHYQGAMAAGENVRIKVADKKLTKGKDKIPLGNVTISSGVAMVRDTDTALSIIERADKAMYYSKENGRNRISGEQDL